MHTNFGVPGLSGYPVIQKHVPALLRAGAGGSPIGISARLVAE